MTYNQQTGQLDLFDQPKVANKADKSSTFSDNLSLPIHRWFRYSAGFSANWVKELIAREKSNGRSNVLDPFAGSATVLLEAEFGGVKGKGVEAHPFISRVGRAKMLWKTDPLAFKEYAATILEEARSFSSEPFDYPELIKKCFPGPILQQLDALKKAWLSSADDSASSELVWLALVSILRECSPVGTAQWQYVLPKKAKAKTKKPFEAYWGKINLMAHDMMICQRQKSLHPAILYQEDARECSSIGDSSIDLVITSPPYANNYDYADATRLEMAFLGEIQGWGDLQAAVRKHLVSSCTQHVSKLKGHLDEMLSSELLLPIRDEISNSCHKLEKEKLNHGGKKDYDLMVCAYFSDLAQVWRALRRVTTPESLVCFVVGDSAPYGIYVPVERWLGELAVAAGFKSFLFEKTRDRNVKWKNRKHRVPLQEGRLWVKG
ncbi:MAG TPA: DNA modification methylase [bacterium]|nr:DNA modification methylase [bacterium]